MTTASNNQPENVLQNIMMRVHFSTQHDSQKASCAFLKQQTRLDKSAVSLSASNLERHGRTILTKQFIKNHKVKLLMLSLITTKPIRLDCFTLFLNNIISHSH